MERQILETVARADLFVCSALRVMAVAVLAVILLAMVLVGRKIADPYRVNYYGPGWDITTEGPEADDPWCDGEDWFLGTDPWEGG